MRSHSTRYALTVPHFSEGWHEGGLIRPNVATFA